MNNKIIVFTKAYNTEDYIEQCIQSVLNQTFKDFKYILFDNGSTDRTKDIIKKYAELDSRIIYLRQEVNSTGGTTLDSLKKYSHESYFMTLDSDDYIESDCVEKLYELVKKNDLDIAVCGSCFHFMENGNIGYRVINEELIIDNNNMPKMFHNIYQFFRPMWAKLVKGSLLDYIDMEENLKFVEIGGYGGDTQVCLGLMSGAKKIGITNKVLHHYRVYKKSVSYQYNKKRFNSDCLLYDASINFLSNYGEISKENLIFVNNVYLGAIYETINLILKSNNTRYEKIIELSKVLRDLKTRRMIEILSKESEEIFNFIKQIYDIFVKIYRIVPCVQIEDSIWGMLCSIYPDYKNALNQNMIKYILISEDVFNKLLLGELKAALSFIYEIIKENDSDLLRQNDILSQINEENFFVNKQELVKAIFCQSYKEALNITLGLIERNEVSEEIIFIMLTLSAILNDADTFIYAKKIKACFCLENNMKENAQNEIRDLMEMIPNDKDIIMLQEAYEKV